MNIPAKWDRAAMAALSFTFEIPFGPMVCRRYGLPFGSGLTIECRNFLDDEVIRLRALVFIAH